MICSEWSAGSEDTSGRPTFFEWSGSTIIGCVEIFSTEAEARCSG